VSQVEQAAKRMGTMLPYYVSRALKELRNRTDVEESEVARIEYAYLPILRFEKEPLTIVGLMSRDPGLFVEVLSHVFRAKGAPAEEVVTDEAKARARASYGLLTMFKTLPGLSGTTILADTLNAWVSSARSLAKSKDLAEICDIRIGYVLAHAPNDPQAAFWPPPSVCAIIESTASDDLERGFSIECFNKRGVYGKAIHEGGDQERQLAEQYRQWSESTHQFPRTSGVLNGIAESWYQHATEQDTRAEQGKLKM
jgi:hypothetical protein